MHASRSVPANTSSPPLRTATASTSASQFPPSCKTATSSWWGSRLLRFEEVPDAEKTLRPAVEHGMILFGTPLKSPWGRLRQITAAGTSRDVYT